MPTTFELGEFGGLFKEFIPEKERVSAQQHSYAAFIEDELGIKRPKGMSIGEFIRLYDPILRARRNRRNRSVFDPLSGGGRGRERGGAGGGAGGSGRPRRDVAAERIALRAQFAGSAFAEVGFDVSQYIDEAVRRGQHIDFVFGRIMADKRFKERFPGIMNRQGGLLVSPAEYQERFDRYSELSRSFGVGISRRTFGRLVQGRVSENEFGFRLQAFQVARANPQVFADLNRVLKQAGIQPLKRAKDLFKFIAGKRPDIDEIYEAAFHLSSATAAGVSLSVQDARRIAQQTAGHLTKDESEERFQRIGQQLRTAAPELEDLGVSARELQIIEFGGPGRATLAAKAEQALRNRQARLEGSLASSVERLRDGRPVIGDTRRPGL